MRVEYSNSEQTLQQSQELHRIFSYILMIIEIIQSNDNFIRVSIYQIIGCYFGPDSILQNHLCIT